MKWDGRKGYDCERLFRGQWDLFLKQRDITKNNSTLN